MKTRAPLIIALGALAGAAACATTNFPTAATPAAPSVLPSRPVASSSAPPSAAAGCEALETRRAIARELFRDDELRGYICEEAPCSAEELRQGLTFTEVVLRDAPRTAGCIVGPLHEAMTRIYSVFVVY
jgi:hypothetical protein